MYLNKYALTHIYTYINENEALKYGIEILKAENEGSRFECVYIYV
jgi:hypothetical protein